VAETLLFSSKMPGHLLADEKIIVEMFGKEEVRTTCVIS
jgi:hypothetical protein